MAAMTWKFSSWRLRSQRLTESRVSSVSLRSEGRRIAVKDLGRRQSGGISSLSANQNKRGTSSSKGND